MRLSENWKREFRNAIFDNANVPLTERDDPLFSPWEREDFSPNSWIGAYQNGCNYLRWLFDQKGLRVMPKQIVVTRHPALLRFLLELGEVDSNTPVLTHAKPEDVLLRHVFGVLPLRLAEVAWRLTEVSMYVPEQWRGKELTIDQIRVCNPELRTYEVRSVR